MKNIRTILVVTGALYTVVSIILLLNEEALYNNLNLLSLMDYFKFWLVLGLILLVGLMVVGSLHIRNLQSRYHRLEQDHAGVKARLYDIEEAKRTEDEEAGRRIEAFRDSLHKGNRPQDPPAPEEGV